MRLGAHPADHAGLQPGPVVRRRGAAAARNASPTDRELSQLLRAGRAFVDVSFDRDHLADRQLAIVERREPPPDRRARQERHAVPQLRPQALARPGQT